MGMANKWVRAIGLGTSMLLSVSQMCVYAAPEEEGFTGVSSEESFEEDDFGDLLEERFAAEIDGGEEAEEQTKEDADNNLTEETEAAELTASGTEEVPVWKDGKVMIKGKEVKNYTGLAVSDADSDWVYINNGKYDESYAGFVLYDGERFYVEGGKMQTTKSGVVPDPNTSGEDMQFYFCANGMVQRNHEGLALYDGEWFYIKDGLVQIKKNAFVKYDGGLFAVAVGRIVGEYSGLMQDPENTTSGDWYFFANGQAQTQYTGLTQYDGEWFYVIDGKLATSFTGPVEYDGESFYVVNGMLSKTSPESGGGNNNSVGTYHQAVAVPTKCINPVKDSAFSVTPNDGIDDTAEINHALTVAACDTSHHTVYLPAGVYDISIQGGEGKSALLFQYEGVKLVMDENAVLRLASNSYSGYNAILIHANNVSITGGQLIGERAGHSSAELGYGHGIAVDRAHATIENMKISSNRGDGIYLADSGKKTECFDVTIKNCEIFDNSRSNISVVRADNVALINCDLHDAQGTAPMAAMNIEPNRSGSGSFYCCNHISVKDTVFSSYGNQPPYEGAYGLWCNYALLVLSHTGGTVATDLNFDNCIFNGAFDNGDTQGTTATGCTFNGDIYDRSPLSIN